MNQLRPGLWTWTGRHPDWTPGEDWGPEVRSYAVELGDRIVLIDPVTPPAELLQKGNVDVVLTAHWHRRSSADIAEPLAELPEGIEAKPGFYPDDRMLWLREHRALVLGDSLMYAEAQPDEWLGGKTRDEYNAALRPLLELPIELLLPTHGDSVTRDAHAHLARELGTP